MSLDFIFMLTRDDRTVADAAAHVRTALALGVRWIGFKDVGVPLGTLHELHALIRAGGAKSCLEIVSLDVESELASARAAVEIGVDRLLGGTRPERVLPLVAGSGIEYFPFAGRVRGHPSVLEGPLEAIVDSARRIAALPGTSGIDLLAWRFDGDVPELLRRTCAAIDGPVIVAGSIDTPDRIRDVAKCGAAGFTVGRAALDGAFPADDSHLSGQLGWILSTVARFDGERSPDAPSDTAPGFDRTDPP